MTHYKTLNVEPTATDAEIKKAYKKSASKLHPDKPTGDTVKFQELQTAYAILSDPDKRHEYDNPRPQHHSFNFNQGHGGADLDIGAMMREMMARQGGGGGQYYQQPQKNKDIRVNIMSLLAETLAEQKKTISIQGTNGNRFNVDVTIPRGAQHGTTIRYNGQGDDYNSKLVRGDLYIVINVMSASNFELHGINVITPLEITSFDAILGADKEVVGIDGKTFSVKIPPACQYGAKFGLNGQGLYALNSEQRGNLIVFITIKTPELTDEQKIALRKAISV